MTDLECVENTADVLGEVPRWHVTENALYWIDAFKPAVHRFDPATGKTESWTPHDKLGSFAPIASGGLLLAGRNGFVLYDPRSGRYDRISDPENGATVNILNDGRCDSHGRFWVGSMSRTIQSPTGSLYRLERGKTDKLGNTIWVANGLAFSPDDKRMYFADSHLHMIFAYDFDVDSGTVGTRHEFAKVDPKGSPDGAAVDENGFLWIALFDGGCVARYAPDGRLDRVIEMPVSRPTAVTFGGPGLRTLYVTTARFRLAPEKLASETHAGGLLALDVGVAGLPEPMYAG